LFIGQQEGLRIGVLAGEVRNKDQNAEIRDNNADYKRWRHEFSLNALSKDKEMNDFRLTFTASAISGNKVC